MMTSATPPWESKRTGETRMVEDFLKLKGHFERVDSYRYNSASVRIRVVDPRFEGLSREERDTIVEKYLDKLPLETQRDIVTLFTFAPSDLEKTPSSFKDYLFSIEFEEPSPSML